MPKNDSATCWSVWPYCVQRMCAGTDREEERGDHGAAGAEESAPTPPASSDRARGENRRHPRRLALELALRRRRGTMERARRRREHQVVERRPDGNAAGREVHETVEDDRAGKIRDREPRAPQVVVVVGAQRPHPRSGGELSAGAEPKAESESGRRDDGGDRRDRAIFMFRAL